MCERLDLFNNFKSWSWSKLRFTQVIDCVVKNKWGGEWPFLKKSMSLNYTQVIDYLMKNWCIK